jgi:hypothetical protein
MDARAEVDALISLWKAEREGLQSVIEDPTTTSEIRVRRITTLVKLVMKMQALVIELKDSETIH